MRLRIFRQTAAATVLVIGLSCLPAGAQTFSDAMTAFNQGRVSEAAQIFADLAKDGEPSAQYNLALLYLTGEGLPQNFREAYHWAWRARLQGLAEADAVLTRIAGDIPDPVRREVATQIEAELQTRIAAGDGRAMLALSIVYSQMLPQPDPEKTYIWQSMAAALGTTGAAALRDATWDQLAAARRLPAQDAAQAAFVSWCATATVEFPACNTSASSN